VHAGLASNIQRFLSEQGAHGAFYGKLHVHNRTLAKAKPVQDLGASLNPTVSGALPLQHCCQTSPLLNFCSFILVVIVVGLV